jgi:hypothetical protein
VVNEAINRAFKEQVGVTNVKRPNIRISYEPVKGRPLADGATRVMQPGRPVSPPPAGEGEPVAWPPPPPDVVRSEPEAETVPASQTWESNWEPTGGQGAGPAGGAEPPKEPDSQ